MSESISCVVGANNAAMTSDFQGNIYFTGSHSASVCFGNYNLNLSPGNQSQMYVASINDQSAVTSFDEYLQIGSMNIFPNPSTNFITIALRELLVNAELKITSSVGDVVYLEAVKQPSFNWSRQINVSQLEKGLYIVELEDLSAHKIIRANKLIIQ